MDQTIRQQIVIAAAQLAGKGADASAVMVEAKRIAALAAPGSAVMNAIEHEIGKVAEAPVGKPFVGTLLHVDVETSSQRGVLFLATSNGVEALRTDITRGNQAAQQLVQSLAALVGHKLVLTKKNEPWRDNPNRSTRVLVTYEDQGLDVAAVDAPGFGMDWASWDGDKDNGPHSDKLKLASSGKSHPVRR